MTGSVLSWALPIAMFLLAAAFLGASCLFAVFVAMQLRRSART